LEKPLALSSIRYHITVAIAGSLGSFRVFRTLVAATNAYFDPLGEVRRGKARHTYGRQLHPVRRIQYVDEVLVFGWKKTTNACTRTAVAVIGKASVIHHMDYKSRSAETIGTRQ